MPRDIVAHDVAQAEGAAFGQSDDGAGQRVYFFDRVLVVNSRHHAILPDKRANAIADEVGCVFADDRALAEHRFGKFNHRSHDFRQCVLRGDHFEQF